MLSKDRIEADTGKKRAWSEEYYPAGRRNTKQNARSCLQCIENLRHVEHRVLVSDASYVPSYPFCVSRLQQGTDNAKQGTQDSSPTTVNAVSYRRDNSAYRQRQRNPVNLERPALHEKRITRGSN